MMKDPVCGMDIEKDDAKFSLELGRETLFFCSDQCKKTYAQMHRGNSSVVKKGLFSRFLEKLAKQNQQTFGGQPPKCH